MDAKNIISLLLISIALTTEAFAQKRVALVIGNGDYQEQSLQNPANDARDISRILRSLGFEVDLKLNASQEKMENAVQRFGEKLQANTVGLFYYSGHGVQYEGSNYLIPIGAMSSVSSQNHLRYKTVDVGYVLGVMREAENGLNIVVLDACRNNPFRSFSRNMNKGLKIIPGAEGTIIAYSTSPGKVALDGIGRNSPYTKQLIKHMQEPNLPVEIMFKKVRKGVKSNTNGKQSPWYEASIDGDFYFRKKHIEEKKESTQNINQLQFSNVKVNLHASLLNPYKNSVLKKLKGMGVKVELVKRRRCEYSFCKGNNIYYNKSTDYKIARSIKNAFSDNFTINLIPRTAFENELTFEIDY